MTPDEVHNEILSLARDVVARPRALSRQTTARFPYQRRPTNIEFTLAEGVIALAEDPRGPATAARIASLEAWVEVARAEIKTRDGRIAELETLLEERSAGHLAELERIQERANQETAVHRHETQRAVTEAGDTRREARELEARVRQLEAEAAAQAAQTIRLASDAARAERERDGYRQIAHGWQGVALARDDLERVEVEHLIASTTGRGARTPQRGTPQRSGRRP